MQAAGPPGVLGDQIIAALRKQTHDRVVVLKLSVDTGHNRKTDALDAHSVAVVGVRTKTLRVLRRDCELEAMRMLTDRPRSAHSTTGPDRVPTASAAGRTPARTRQEGPHHRSGQGLLASVRPRDSAGKTRRRIAAEELAA